MYRDSGDNSDAEVLSGYTVDDIDETALRAYRTQFANLHPDHPWTKLLDTDFLRQIQALRTERTLGTTNLTAAGLLMFGKSLPRKEQFGSVQFDYLDCRELADGERWRDRLTEEGHGKAMYTTMYVCFCRDCKANCRRLSD